MVTVVDPATQKTKLVELPTHFNAGASRPLWKPLLDALHARMKARGLEDTMMLGLEDDVWASKEELVLFKEISGDLPWVMQVARRGDVQHAAVRDIEDRLPGRRMDGDVFRRTTPSGRKGIAAESRAHMGMGATGLGGPVRPSVARDGSERLLAARGRVGHHRFAARQRGDWGPIIGRS